MEEKIFYESTDNIKLCGLLSLVNDNKKIVILAHGLNGDKTSDNFNALVGKLQDYKINSFRFDFRAHGESTGNDYEMTPLKEVEDLEKTIEMLNNKGFEEIIVLGSSFGASIVSLIDYKKYPSIKGLILWYGALDYLATIEQEGFFTEEHKKIAEQQGYYQIKSRRRGRIFKLGLPLYNEVYKIVPYEHLKTVNLPKLFVHGLEDTMIPYELSVKVSKLCNNSRLELIEKGEHSFRDDKGALDKAIDVSIDFIKELI